MSRKTKNFKSKASRLAAGIRNGSDSICKESARCYFSRNNIVVPKQYLLAHLPELAGQTFKPFVEKPAKAVVDPYNPGTIMETVLTKAFDAKKVEAAPEIVKKTVKIGSKTPIAALRYVLMESEKSGFCFYFGTQADLFHSQMSKEFQAATHNSGDYWTCVGGGFHTLSSGNARMFDHDEILIWGRSGDYGAPSKERLDAAIGEYNSNNMTRIRHI